MRLILGSGSPRRQELLSQIGVVADEIRPPQVNEDPRPGERPRPYCDRIVRDKAAALEPASDEVILVADTTVALGRRILGKPATRAEAEAFLTALSGRRHRVLTGVAVRDARGVRARLVESVVRMRHLQNDDIVRYLETNDWQGKAGGYAIQGPAAAFVPWISGSFSGIVGLPLAETSALLRAAGIEVPV